MSYNERTEAIMWWEQGALTRIKAWWVVTTPKTPKVMNTALHLKLGWKKKIRTSVSEQPQPS